MAKLNYLYANQVLNENNVSIVVDGEPILEPPKDKYKIKPLRTRLTLGSLSQEEKVIEKITTCAELYSLFGYGIEKVKVQKPWRRLQRAAYVLTKRKDNEDNTERFFTKMPKGYYIEHDPFNKKIRLVGANAGPLGYGWWVDLKPKARPDYNIRYSMFDYVERADDVITRVWDMRLPAKDEKRILEIPDIPIMISDDGSIVCIPKMNDMAVIGFVGKRGSGKTTGINSLIGRLYWKFKDKNIIGNDPLNQTTEWALPNVDKGQHKELSIINEHPLPLPVVGLHPVIGGKEKDKLQVSFNFRDLIENYRIFSQGLEDIGLSLDKSEKWFLKLKSEIKKCKSFEEVKQLISDEYSGEKRTEIREKINTVLSNIEEINFTDLSSGVPSMWDINGKKRFPLTALPELGIIPSLMTGKIKRSVSFYPSYMKYFLDKIIEYQENHKGRVWLHLDEIGDFYKKGDGRKTVAAHSLNYIFTQGRPIEIGTVFSIQNYSMLDEEMRNNINYLFTFVYTSRKEITTISKDFGLPDYRMNEIVRLKNHQCIGIPSLLPFKVYPHDGEPYLEYEKSFRGYIIPPITQHKKPTLR